LKKELSFFSLHTQDILGVKWPGTLLFPFLLLPRLYSDFFLIATHLWRGDLFLDYLLKDGVKDLSQSNELGQQTVQVPFVVGVSPSFPKDMDPPSVCRHSPSQAGRETWATEKIAGSHVVIWQPLLSLSLSLIKMNSCRAASCVLFSDLFHYTVNLLIALVILFWFCTSVYQMGVRKSSSTVF
jgi:hypothetical protein